MTTYPSRTRREDGGLILDVLIGMAIFALIAFIATTAVNQYRARAYVQAALSDAKQVGEAVEAGRIGTDAYPVNLALLPEGVVLSNGVSVARYEVAANGEDFMLCTEHERGGWAAYSSKGVTSKGSDGTCADAPGFSPEPEPAPVTEPVIATWGALAHDYSATVPADVDPADIVDLEGGTQGGLEVTVALLTDGTVRTWGTGTGSLSNVPADLGRVVDISVGRSHALALLEDGTVRAWGADAGGSTVVPASLSNVIDVAAGTHHSLALTGDGRVVAWGRETPHEPGFNDGFNTAPPELANVTSITAGTNLNVATTATGQVVVWGQPDATSWVRASNPDGLWRLNAPSALSNANRIAAGGRYVHAVKPDGTLAVVGPAAANVSGLFGPLTDLVDIKAGEQYGAGVTADGSLRQWGFPHSPAPPANTPPPTHVTAFGVGPSHLVVAGVRETAPAD